MKKLKKLITLVLAMCMIFSMTTIASAEDAEYGSFENPWQLSATSMRFYVYLEAGATQYVQVDDCDGTTANVVYVADETEEYAYFIQYGRQSVMPEADGLAQVEMMNMPGADYFSLTNTGEADITVFMTLTKGAAADTTGTMENPEELTFAPGFMGRLMAIIENQMDYDNEGYFYTITAPQDGVINFRMNGAFDEEFNELGWTYFINVVSGEEYSYGEMHWSDDEEPVYSETFNVKEGDVLTVFVATYTPNVYNNPEGLLAAELSFAAKGSAGCPEELEIGEKNVTLAAGSEGYYYVYIAEETGEFIFTMDSEDMWQYAVSNVTAEIYGDIHWSDDEEVVTQEKFAVTEGDRIEIWVNTYNPEEYFAPAGTVEFTTAIDTPDAPPAGDDTPDAPPAGDDTPDAPPAGDDTPDNNNDADQNVKPGDTANVAMLLVVAALASAVVIFKKKTVME